MSKKIRISKHNARSGKNGVFNVSHNDRSAYRDEKDKHIHPELTQHNLNWSWNGNTNFKESEREFYQRRYGKTIEARNQRYIAQGHREKCRTVEDLLQNSKTCPQEVILQIGQKEHQEALERYYKDPLKGKKAMLYILAQAVNKYRDQIENENVHILNISIHADETSIHAHCRIVYDYINEKGERNISQNKALEILGYEPPEPEKPLGRFNNRMQTYDKQTRSWWIEAVKKVIERFQDRTVAKNLSNFDLEPEKGRKHNLEKNDYILQKQEEQIKKNNKLIEYQEAFREFVKDAEEEAEKELERKQQKQRERGR